MATAFLSGEGQDASLSDIGSIVLCRKIRINILRNIEKVDKIIKLLSKAFVMRYVLPLLETAARRRELLRNFLEKVLDTGLRQA